jgi:hypothetical protein
VPALPEAGALPSGETFKDNGNGTATLSGMPGAGSAGSYSLTITASNGVGSAATQSFTLKVNTAQTAPGITSASGTTFTVGTAGSFTVTATGSPAPTLTEAGALPSGVTFKDNGSGTATLSGTPGAGSGGSYTLTITASNGVGSAATQSFTLKVNTAQTAPGITSASSTSFTAGTAGSFTVTATGSPVPTLAEAGALPSGVTFKDNGNGTATLSGMPGAGSGGSYSLTITASNGVGSPVNQSFTLSLSDFSAATAAPTSQTVSPGQNATFALNFTPFNSFAGTVALSCAITPQRARPPTCNLSNSSVQLSGTGTSSVTVTVGTTAPIKTGTTPVPTHFPPTTLLLICAALFFGVAWHFIRNHNLRPVLATLLLVICLVGLASCAEVVNSSHTTPGTPAGTYTATVTATSGALSHTATMTIVVE